MWYKNIAGRFFGHKTRMWQTDRQTDGRTDGQNYDSQDRASITASRGKKKSKTLTSTSDCSSVSSPNLVVWDNNWWGNALVLSRNTFLKYSLSFPDRHTVRLATNYLGRIPIQSRYHPIKGTQNKHECRKALQFSINMSLHFRNSTI